MAKAGEEGRNVLIIRAAIEQAATRLRVAGVEGARQDAWLLLGHTLQQDRTMLLANALEALGAEDQRSFSMFVDRRAGREPLAQIVGRKEFWSLDFQITAEVLCPRPDSECLIEAALAEMGKRSRSIGQSARILDLGTGSGCLLLTFLHEWPEATGIGVDISRQALAIARVNGERLALAERVDWLCADWGAAIEGCFDLIVSNPPYVALKEREALAPEVRDFEPAEALFAGLDGLDAYRVLAGDLRRLLKPGGFALLEVGAGQAQSVESLLENEGFVHVDRRRDLAGIDRCLIVEPS